MNGKIFEEISIMPTDEILILPSVLTLSELQPLHEKYRHLHAKTIQIDAGELEHIDTAALQWLLAISRANTVRWERTSQTLEMAACMIGLQAALGLPHVLT
jgi:ABC-type transporter Mla MlaB component